MLITYISSAEHLKATKWTVRAPGTHNRRRSLTECYMTAQMRAIMKSISRVISLQHPNCHLVAEAVCLKCGIMNYEIVLKLPSYHAEILLDGIASQLKRGGVSNSPVSLIKFFIISNIPPPLPLHSQPLPTIVATESRSLAPCFYGTHVCRHTTRIRIKSFVTSARISRGFTDLPPEIS